MLALATYGYGIGMVFLIGFLLRRPMRLPLRIAVLALCLIAPPLLAWFLVPLVPRYGLMLYLAAIQMAQMNLFGLFVGGIWHIISRKMAHKVQP